MRKAIKIKFQNGINYQIAVEEIFNELTNEFDFIESDNPDFILFGPYGNDIPPKGNYTRIGYFCENFTPDLSICEWAFGVPREEEINHPKYKRIQWHGLNPNCLIKNLSDNDIDQIVSQKIKFCNFIFSNKVPYREEFFKQLSKYKKIDAPGKSMNNMASIDNKYIGTVWERKRQFLTPYKFTIAFENYSFPGYQTEKLYDAMQVNSLPIYCGDPEIGQVFNTKSFLNAQEYIPVNNKLLISWLEQNCQYDFIDILPQYYKTPYHRIKRKVKSIGRNFKMKLQFNKLDFSNLIDRVIELDTNPELYLNCMKQPWLKGNAGPTHLSTKQRWIEIFNSKQVL